ncbi:hypothetical protein [Nocardia amamiensis]
MSAPEPAATTSAADFLAPRGTVLSPIARAWRAWLIWGGGADEPGAGR